MILVELAHFPSHIESATNCETTLRVEVFRFSESQHVTLRMTGEVPVRYAYDTAEDLVHKLKKGLRLILGTDPVFLKENISQYSETQRAMHSLRLQGTTRFRIELFESVTRTGKGASFGPGIGAGLYKGSNNLYIFSRIHASMQLPGASHNLIERPIAVGLDAGFNWEFNQLKPVTGYIGAGVGLLFLRLRGEVKQQEETVNSVLAQGFFRIGVRMFRLTNFDMDIFTSAYLPFYPASDVDATMLGNSGRTYTPHVQMGLGVGF